MTAGRLSLSTADTDRLQGILERGTEGGIPGLSAAAGIGDRVVWLGAAGCDDLLAGTPVTPTSRFGIGSITKTFVAQLVLKLMQERTLRKDNTARDFLSSEVLDGIANSDASILHLLRHQSGIPDWEKVPEWIRDARGSGSMPGKIWRKDEPLDHVRGLPAVFKPGMRYEYCNTNYTLLGLIVEEITGNSLSLEIRQQILAPLWLCDTGMDTFEADRRVPVHNYHFATRAYSSSAGMNTGYPEVRPGLIETSGSNLSCEWAAGGMVSTAEDLLRWAFVVQRGDFLGPAFHRTAFRYHPPQQVGNEEEQYMMGVMRIPDYFNGNDAAGHGGATLGFTARMYWFEPSGVTLVLLTNAGEMHTGLRPSPTGEFYRDALLSALLELV